MKGMLSCPLWHTTVHGWHTPVTKKSFQDRVNMIWTSPLSLSDTYIWCCSSCTWSSSWSCSAHSHRWRRNKDWKHHWNTEICCLKQSKWRQWCLLTYPIRSCLEILTRFLFSGWWIHRQLNKNVLYWTVHHTILNSNTGLQSGWTTWLTKTMPSSSLAPPPSSVAIAAVDKSSLRGAKGLRKPRIWITRCFVIVVSWTSPFGRG